MAPEVVVETYEPIPRGARLNASVSGFAKPGEKKRNSSPVYPWASVSQICGEPENRWARIEHGRFFVNCLSHDIGGSGPGHPARIADKVDEAPLLAHSLPELEDLTKDLEGAKQVVVSDDSRRPRADGVSDANPAPPPAGIDGACPAANPLGPRTGQLGRGRTPARQS